MAAEREWVEVLIAGVKTARQSLDDAQAELLKALRETPREDRNFWELVKAARDAGCLLETIGGAAGLTGERVRQLIARGGDSAPRQGRGVDLTPDEVRELQALYASSDPRSSLYHTSEYRAKLAELVGRGVTYSRLAAVLGVSKGAIGSQLNPNRPADTKLCGARTKDGGTCRRFGRCWRHGGAS